MPVWPRAAPQPQDRAEPQPKREREPDDAVVDDVRGLLDDPEDDRVEDADVGHQVVSPHSLSISERFVAHDPARRRSPA